MKRVIFTQPNARQTEAARDKVLRMSCLLIVCWMMTSDAGDNKLGLNPQLNSLLAGGEALYPQKASRNPNKMSKKGRGYGLPHRFYSNFTPHAIV
jgi:hypothetical protein